jgi:hypothetical protein
MTDFAEAMEEFVVGLEGDVTALKELTGRLRREEPRTEDELETHRDIYQAVSSILRGMVELYKGFYHLSMLR